MVNFNKNANSSVKKQKKISLANVAIIMSALLVALAFFFLSCWYTAAKESVKHQVEQVVYNSASEQAAFFKSDIESRFCLLDSFATTFQKYRKNRIGSYIEIMNLFKENSGFSQIILMTPTKELFGSDGKVRTECDATRLAISRGMLDKRSFTYSSVYSDTTNRCIVLSVPCTLDGEVIAVLLGEIGPKSFKSGLRSKAYGGRVYSCIINSMGYFVAGDKQISYTKEDKNNRGAVEYNLLSTISRSKYIDKETSDVLADLRNGREGRIRFNIDGQMHLAVYKPTGIEDLYLFSFAPADIIEGEMARTMGGVYFLIVSALLFVLAAVVFVFIKGSVNKNMLATEKGRLRLLEEEYYVLTEQTRKHVTRYDITASTLYLTQKTSDEFGAPSVIHGMPDVLINSGRVVHESLEDVRNFFAEIKGGKKYVSATEQFLNLQGSPMWIRMNAVTVLDEKNTPSYAVILLEDVSEQREKELAYERWLRTISAMKKDRTMVVEYNLTSDTMEKISGSLSLKYEDISDVKGFSNRVAAWAHRNIFAEDIESYMVFLRLDRLFASFYSGIDEESLDFRAYTSDGDCRWFRITVQIARYPDSDEIKAFLLYRDIHEEKMKSLSVETKAREDALTGILNRGALKEEIILTLENMPDSRHAFFMMDLDKFKLINDTFGHIAGDKVLMATAMVLKSILRHGDYIGRIGGDEFVVFLKDIPDTSVVTKRAETICKMLNLDLGSGVDLSISIGISVYPKDGSTFDELYRSADVAIYKAKENGRNRYELYHSDMNDDSATLHNTPIDSQETAESGTHFAFEEEKGHETLMSEKISIDDLLARSKSMFNN